METNQELENLRRLLEQSQRREEELKKREEESKKREEESKKHQQKLEQHAAGLERQMVATTLPEYLDACHVHIFSRLRVRDAESSTQGDPANATNKYRPERIREWVDFPSEQEEIWNQLMDVSFVAERHFTSLVVLEDVGQNVRRKMMGSEIDLGYFEQHAVQDRVEMIIEKLFANERLRRIFKLHGEISFENHANTITDDTNPAGESTARPRADQFCVYNRGPETNVPAFIVEYKAPHKVSLVRIRAGLREMDVSLVERYKGTKNVKKACSYLIAAIISQTYHYMIQAGLEYGYVCTGEAFIFLRIPSSEPTTVLYFLSIPSVEVGKATGFSNDPGSSDDNRLHLTAVGQVLAFTLRSLQSAPRDQAWVDSAQSQLEKWGDVDDTTISVIPEGLVSLTEPMQETRRGFARLSPVKTRSKGKAAARFSCDPQTSSKRSGKDEDDESSENEFDPDTPSRKPRASANIQVVMRPPASTERSGQASDGKGKSRQYCTHKCILGLVSGGSLDKTCPNVKDHGVKSHPIDQFGFIALLQKQLLRGNLDLHSILGCKSLHIHGARAALFEVTLFAYGYKLVAKGVPRESIPHLKREEKIYERLSPVQGIYVPVCLGSVDLTPRPVWYDGIAQIFRLMVLSYAGTLIRHHANVKDVKQFSQPAGVALKAIHNTGVLHNDPHRRNMVWNAERSCIMFIDFDRARIIEKERTPLGLTSPNRKRKRRDSDPEKDNHDMEYDDFQLDLIKMYSNMS